MAKAASRSSANTVLVIGAIRAEIGLYGTKADSAKLAKFEQAGPSGKRLMTEKRAVEKEQPQEAVPVQHDPLGSGLEAEIAESSTTAASPVAGEFRQVLVEEAGGDVVAPEDVRRGVFVERDGRERFVDCTDQLTAIDERTKLERIEVIATVDATQVRRERVIGAYYLGAQTAGAKPRLRLLYEALRQRREVAVVKYTTRSRQQLGIIAPNAKTGTLILQQLVYAEDWREPHVKALAIQTAKVESRQVDAMAAVLGALRDTFEAVDEQRDEAITLREELLARAKAGEMDVEVVEPLEAEEQVPDLMAALQESLRMAAEKAAA